MNQQEFLRTIKVFQSAGYSLIEKKNSDYAGEQDPFKNFKLFEFIIKGVDISTCDRTQLAMLVRIIDKIQRVANLLSEDKAKVNDESIEDTLLDIANYCHIMLAYRKDKNKRWFLKEEYKDNDEEVRDD